MWLNKNIRHQADWSKVSLYPSPSFLAKNHLVKEGPDCVAPVVIPALAPTLDKSLKEDRSLCSVRVLRYYLDKTQDLRQGKELVFVSFKKGFTKDISPAMISSWIKQTVILCYEPSYHESLTLHQVKAHDVRAFAASKAFQGGISLDQILAPITPLPNTILKMLLGWTLSFFIRVLRKEGGGTILGRFNRREIPTRPSPLSASIFKSGDEKDAMMSRPSCE